MVVLEETFIRMFLPRLTRWLAVKVLLPAMGTTLLQIPALSIVGMKLVLTFRTPRVFVMFRSSIGEDVGLMVMIPMLGPPSPRHRFILAMALLALIFVMKTLILLLALL